MAFTEYYVAADAAGGGIGTIGDPFTLTEALEGLTVGALYWIESGSYTVATSEAVDTAGTSASFNLFKGYSTTTGDLDTQGRNSDGSLNTTNFPVITITDSLTIPSYVFFMNCEITGSYAGDMLGNSASDHFGFINCKLTNSADSTLANLIRGDDQVTTINCDFYTGTGSFYSVIRCDYFGLIQGCRCIVTGTTSNSIFEVSVPTIVGCWVSGNGQVVLSISSTTSDAGVVVSNTFYNCGDIIELPNSSITNLPYLINNHATDSTGWINNLYSATANAALIEVNNRVRDITTLRTGVGDGIVLDEVDTDTGGPETDYTDYANGDLSLIPTAPGIDAGLGFGIWNIGASQNEYSSTGGGGGIIKVDLNGGIN